MWGWIYKVAFLRRLRRPRDYDDGSLTHHVAVYIPSDLMSKLDSLSSRVHSSRSGTMRALLEACPDVGDEDLFAAEGPEDESSDGGRPRKEKRPEVVSMGLGIEQLGADLRQR